MHTGQSLVNVSPCLPKLSLSREKRGGTPTRHTKLEEQVETLQAELEKKTHMLFEVKKHLREAAEREQRLQEVSMDPKVGCGPHIM